MRYRTSVMGWIAAVAVMVLSMSSFSLAGDRDHDGGFFLRLSAGPGFASTKIDNEFEEVKLSGGAGDVNLAIGAIVSPNLALHGTLFGWLVSDPEVEENGKEIGDASGDLDVTGFGGGVTYYIMPANVYLSGSIGIGTLTFDSDFFEDDLESDAGVIIDLTVGKEWWVGRKWALGVAGGVGLHSLPWDEVDESWTGASFGVRFSATMN